MPGPLLPHRAGYEFIGPTGDIAGHEELAVERGGPGWRITSRIETTWPEDIQAGVDWELGESMVTRLLQVHSHGPMTGDCELELTVTGNGLLAHRQAPDGPTQVELGWGPDAEIDYISAAFPAVMLARSDLAAGAIRTIDAVQLGTGDLVPTIVPVRLRRLQAHEPRTAPPGTAIAPVTSEVECTVFDTGHVAVISTAESGALVGYSGLLRLAWLEPTK